MPKFFILSSYAYQTFLKYNHINITDNYEEIRKNIDLASFPKGLEEEIYHFYNQYQFVKVSVRSSALNEDGKYKYFAGQYQTILNVEKEKLLESINVRSHFMMIMFVHIMMI